MGWPPRLLRPSSGIVPSVHVEMEVWKGKGYFGLFYFYFFKLSVKSIFDWLLDEERIHVADNVLSQTNFSNETYLMKE